MKKNILIFSILALFCAVGCSRVKNGAITQLAQNACQTCHEVPPTVGTHAVTYHQKFIDQCGLCHAGYDSITANPATHQNGKVDTAMVHATDNRCKVCHGPGSGGTGCRQCHGIPPAAGAHVVPKHQKLIGQCSNCHSGYDSTTVNAQKHINSVVDTSFHRATDVNCRMCHSGGGTGCASCHAFPPAEIFHKTHVTDKKFDCNVCHPGNPSITGPKNSGTFHENDTVNVAFKYPFTLTPAVTNTGWNATTGTCSAVYCHGNFKGGLNSGSVSEAAKITCGSCHALPPRNDGQDAHSQIDHASFIADCSKCHPGYNSITKIVNPTNHINGVVNALFDRSVAPCNDCH